MAAILVKLRPSASLGVAERRANLRPLFPDDAPGRLGLAAEARWFAADLPDGADTPWDLAHARVADQLGVDASDVVFAEPDLVHGVYPDPTGEEPDGPFAVAPNCQKPERQDKKGGVATGPGNEAWHLDDEFSQLAAARAAVAFGGRRTRIAHFDTGYSRRHSVRPANVLTQLERSFVEEDGAGASAVDPDRNVFLLDNSGHGTGTLSVLAGGKVAAWNDKVLGGAPDADILPLRLADSVVMLKTSAFARALEHAITHHCDVMTMSMGGLPSKLWREMVDLAYGVAIASRCGIGDVVTGFGDPRRPLAPQGGDGDLSSEARMMAATCGGVRVVNVYACHASSNSTPSMALMRSIRFGGTPNCTIVPSGLRSSAPSRPGTAPSQLSGR